MLLISAEMMLTGVFSVGGCATANVRIEVESYLSAQCLNHTVLVSVSCKGIAV